ncbi:MAG TPA: 5'/3'-nucleotidase SurE [Rhodospirillaceae bacterium]|nr:MAG: 5'/3'-nucleotidase SurE [Alphaproteobacteria bacterium GWF2_58_20]HAU29355.1 5'/3'-nucleotidase SurE [Rhodospirillaceae bacterium]
MRTLLVNDDGISAPGLAVLEEIARALSDDVWVVAPQTEQSAISHALTLRQPIRVHQHDEKRFSITGTPADCVQIALLELVGMTDGRKPDLVLSGINMGPNLADDLVYSGTLGAAMEAAMFGVPAMALSQFIVGGEPVNWAVARKQGADIVRALLKAGGANGSCFNINFPAVSGDVPCPVKVVRQGVESYAGSFEGRKDPRGHSYYWNAGRRKAPDAFDGRDDDVTHVHAGGISVTPLRLDWTHEEAMKGLEGVFA